MKRWTDENHPHIDLERPEGYDTPRWPAYAFAAAFWIVVALVLSHVAPGLVDSTTQPMEGKPW